MTPELKDRIEALIKGNKIMVFMKGNKLTPKCGFSNNVVQIFTALGVPFETFDVLEDWEIRSGINEFAEWSQIPLVYIDGKFIGSSDILSELYKKGELQQLLGVAPESE